MCNQLEEIERKRRERAAARQARQQQAAEAHVAIDADKHIYVRQWLRVRDTEAASASQRLRIVSWNMLAQGLVRRELFPGSDCLKYRHRQPGLQAELASYDWDIGCFQEVDNIDDHAATLERGGYSHVYEKGYESKRHGLMIAWRSRDERASPNRRPCFTAPAERKVVYFDDAAPDSRCTGLSRATRNIGLIIALPSADARGGVVVATTHLFWHPAYAYERVRQAGLFLQEIRRFREGASCEKWPVVLAGDFNDQPHSASYTLLTGQMSRFEPVIEEQLRESRVVHASVDALRGADADATDTVAAEEGDDEDRILGSHRAPADGELLSTVELKKLFVEGSCAPRSAYGTAYDRVESGTEKPYFKVRLVNALRTQTQDRGTEPERYDETEKPPPSDLRQLDSCEPKWTLYSQLFRLTLGECVAQLPLTADYIMLFPQENGKHPIITSLLRLHPQDILAPGVPRRSVCASDHIMIGAEIAVDMNPSSEGA